MVFSSYKDLDIKAVVLNNKRRQILKDLTKEKYKTQSNFRNDYGWKSRATTYHFAVLEYHGLIELDKHCKPGAMQIFYLTDKGKIIAMEFGLSK